MEINKSWTILFGLAFAITSGCVGGSKGLSSDDKEKLKPFILDSEPADLPHKTDVNFENRVHLVGYEFEPELARPGSDVKLTYYWRCDDAVDGGWSLFTHVHDDISDKSDNLDWVGPLRENRNNHQILGPDRWERGKIYVDEQTYKIPEWVKGPDLTIMVGIWKAAARLRILSGPNDGDNRAIVGKIKTGLAPVEQQKKTEIPSVTVNKLASGQTIVIDGKGDDKAWQGAAAVGPFVEVGTGRSSPMYPIAAAAKLTWDDKNLYVLAEIKETDLVAGFTEAAKQKGQWTVSGQPKLWTRDNFEIMTDPDGDGDNKDYYELQINPQNKVFHTQYDSYNAPQTPPDGPWGHEDWDPKLKSAVVAKGTIDKSDDKDEGYTVEAQIPWAAFAKAAHHPPKSGDSWRMNFYAVRSNAAVAWSPILGQGNFHKATRFGRIVWSDGTVALNAAPAAGAGDGGAVDETAAAAGANGDGGTPRMLRAIRPMMPPLVH